MRAVSAALGFAILLIAARPVNAQYPHAVHALDAADTSATSSTSETSYAQPLIASAGRRRSTPGLQRTAAMVRDAGPTAQLGALVLRPAPGLKALADRVARVLSLRFGSGGIDVGEPPPPGLLEAVPAGHLALAAEGTRIRLVLGGVFGTFFEASVPFSPPAREPDVRSLALAVEALRDRAMEARAARLYQRQEERSDALTRQDAAPQLARASLSTPAPPTDVVSIEQPASQPMAAEPSAALSGDRSWGLRDDDSTLALSMPQSEARRLVEPMVYVRAYGGASIDSARLQVGVATGGGLCVRGHCLVLGVESPLPFGPEALPTDIRYRYVTVVSGFYSRPWQFGPFAPAASLGFVSRVGHFRRDMGMTGASAGLDTDLGLRGTLEGSVRVVESVELTSEVGVDYALDRWRLGFGDTVAYRGARAALWAQAGVRVRPL